MAILDTIKNQILVPNKEDPAAKQDKTPLISKLCPHCRGCMLEFYENETSVTCHACDQTIAVAELLAASAPSAEAASAAAPASPAGFITVETPESGLIYLENRFLNYDWKSYAKTSTILLSDIESMVQSNNIKQGAHPYSWLLDFQSVSVPLAKKLEALAELSDEISEAYTDTDTANVLALFDRSKEIAFALIENKDSLLNRLNNDIHFAEKLGIEADKLEQMKAEYEKLSAALDELQPLKKLTDIPAVAKKQEEINLAMIASFKENGIDVVAEYEKAVYFFNKDTSDKRDALNIFESIRGYADTNEYIAKINNYYSYYGEFFNFFGKIYVYKVHKGNTLALDPKAKGEKSGCLGKKKDTELSEEDLFPGDTYELYEVVNNEPDEKPILKSITNIIRYYGSVLYYVKLDKYVCAYDMASGVNQVLLKVDKPEDLKVFIDGLVYASADGKSIYIRKRLELIVEKTGCKDKFFGKKDKVIQRRNNYEVYELDLVKCTCERVIDRVVDIIDQGGEYLFYTVAEELAPGQEETEETKKELAKLAVMALNTTTHEKQLVLEENCHIRKICGNKIIYTVNAPNDWNLDLHIFDIPTMTDTLIEKNVYNFLAESDGRIFYYVGNKSYAPLFSNNYEGTDRVEVMTNIERVVKVLAGWMYVVKGSYRNALLMKISTDGKQRFVICSQFQKAVKVTDTYIYYVTTGNDLRVVRTDGKENLISSVEIAAAKDTEGHAIVPEVCIYFDNVLIRGNRSTKINSDNFRAFRSENLAPLAEAGINIRYNTQLIRKPDSWQLNPTFHKHLDTRVSILKMHPGITPDVVKHILCSPKTRAVIIETYGAGNAPSKEWFLSIVKEAVAMGKILMNVTQCIAGSVNMDIYATGKTLKEAGVLNGYDSTTEAALGKLFYLMGLFQDNLLVKSMMELDLRGEISK